VHCSNGFDTRFQPLSKYSFQSIQSWPLSLGADMRRREFISLLGGGATVAWPLAARAQQSKKIPRLCFLTFDPGTLQATRFAFFEGLRDLGYVDGQSINIDYLSAEGRGERFPALAAECVRRQADIIAVSTTPAARAAKNATRTIPIIMIALGDPVGMGSLIALPNPDETLPGCRKWFPRWRPSGLTC